MSQKIPVLGIDPGSRWTAGVLRYGADARYGWTVGPLDPRGQRDPRSLDRMDAERLDRYVRRVLAYVDMAFDKAVQDYGTCLLAIELPGPPRRRSTLPVRDWLIPWSVAWSVFGRYEGAVLVHPDAYGRRPRNEYPEPLRLRRPPHWGPCEARRGERDHERAAYDVAGVAVRMRGLRVEVA